MSKVPTRSVLKTEPSNYIMTYLCTSLNDDDAASFPLQMEYTERNTVQATDVALKQAANESESPNSTDYKKQIYTHFQTGLFWTHILVQHVWNNDVNNSVRCAILRLLGMFKKEPCTVIRTILTNLQRK
jgi:hypothetical protein